jgi:hypothetical protein
VPVGQRFQFDGALKQFFERQQPSLVMDLTGGVAVKQSLNVELPRVQERKVDLVLLLTDESLLHIEFQGTNSKDMALRISEYYLLLLSRYQRPIRQVVLYVGRPRMRMSSVLDHGPLRFSYSLRDIREWPARKLLEAAEPPIMFWRFWPGPLTGRRWFAKFCSECRGGRRRREIQPSPIWRHFPGCGDLRQYWCRRPSAWVW